MFLTTTAQTESLSSTCLNAKKADIYAPEIEKRLRWYWRNPTHLGTWHIDETYVKVNGRWAYLYRAVDQRDHTIDFYLSARRNTKSAYCFLAKILNNVKKWQIPRVINTDKHTKMEVLCHG